MNVLKSQKYDLPYINDLDDYKNIWYFTSKIIGSLVYDMKNLLVRAFIEQKKYPCFHFFVNASAFAT